MRMSFMYAVAGFSVLGSACPREQPHALRSICLRHEKLAQSNSRRASDSSHACQASHLGRTRIASLVLPWQAFDNLLIKASRNQVDDEEVEAGLARLEGRLDAVLATVP